MMTVGSDDHNDMRRRAGLRALISVGLTSILFTVSACQTFANYAPPAASPSMGFIIARNSCAECHQMGGPGASPNPQAPPFSEIVNRPGMTEEALRRWLQASHNYPVEMGFYLEPHQIDSLVAYMIRWRLD